jgi:hypothetical protein
VRVGASFQALRGLGATEFERAIAKDFGKVRLCYYLKVFMLFCRS